MARIDLSRYSQDMRTNNPSRQVLDGTGRAEAYSALAKFGDTAAIVATDLYHKEQDALTEIQSSRASSLLKQDVAKQKVFALNNRDIDNPNYVSGTTETYDEYMTNYVSTRSKELGDGLSEPLAKAKYAGKTNSFVDETKINSVFEQVRIATEITNDETNKYISTGSNTILYAERDTLAALNTTLTEAQMNLYPMINQVKGVGTTNTMAQQRRVEKSYGEATMESLLRRMQSGEATDQSSLEFSQMMGLSVKFADTGKARKYIIEKYKDFMEGIEPDEGTLDHVMSMITNPNDSAQINEHQVMKHFTPMEKDKYLDRALSIMFKKKEVSNSEFNLRVKDIINSPLTKGYQEGSKFTEPSQYIEEFSRILNDAPTTVPDRAKINYVMEAVSNMVMGEAQSDIYTHGTTAYVTSSNRYKDKAMQYMYAILDRTVGKAKTDEEMGSYQSIGDTITARLEKGLKSFSDQYNTDKMFRPESLVAKDPNYVNLMSSSFRFGANGEPIINDKALKSAVKQRQLILNRIGSIGAKLESQDIIPRATSNRLMAQISTLSPDKQRQFYERINSVDTNMAATLYSTMVREGKMNILDASIAMQSSLGNPDIAKMQQDRLLSFRNDFTGKYEKALLENFQSVGWLNRDVDISDLDKSIAEVSRDSTVLNNLMEVARASGLPSETIKNMFHTSNLQLITKDYMNRNAPTSLPFIESITSTFKGRTAKAFDAAVSEYFGAKVTPVNKNNLKAVIDPNRYLDLGQIDKASGTASNLTGMVFDNLTSGNLRLDLSNMTETQLGKKYKGTDGKFLQKEFLRDLKRDNAISFNTTDVSGQAKELVMMIKDKSGNYYRAKLLDSRGNKVVPLLDGVDELINSSAEDIYNDKFSPLSAPVEINIPKQKKKGK